uniref:CCHC-type domain-containing protein n=1 Tax=Arundo donax TaxID=35708 RepID=A0A0A9H6R7_ARUDO
MSVDEYYTVFSKLSSQLDSMVPKPNSSCKECVARDKYEQQNMMFQFVMGLRSEFEPIRAQLLGRTTLPTMTEALSAVSAEETRLRTLADSSFLPQHTALAAPPQHSVTGATTSQKVIRCKYCGRKGHLEEQCFKLHPELLAQLRARRATSHRATAATAPSNIPLAVSPSTAPVYQPSAPATSTAPVTAYMSGGSVASTTASGSSNQSPWYWPSP